MLLQVSFVFTDQVDGKLTPVESTIKPTTATGEENPKNQQNAKGRVVGQLTTSSRNQTFKPLQRPQIKLTGSSQGVIHLEMKPGLSLRNQLPQKRISPDDDFA